ncbi:Pre-mRNA-splicing factor SYF1 [Olea europaea subsp. europaea]|uniref:Pre-mRNA-splicing factor SYF1 n=1 Tax=Olea europaea subsp. europaea TaxID=158383 RepID=A0A8S0TGB2_OLEEU|nr:Pre-mRNA-splicing factor SYF1 [Olea europaea subsp. europaea]
MDADADQVADTTPTDVASWRYLNLLPCSSELERSEPDKAVKLYKEAICGNPGSYKLWHAYLLFRTRQLEGKPLDDPLYETVNKCFDEALVFMHRMPRIWIEYCTLLDRQLFVTRTRRAFNKAIESLPVTQHTRIWPLYIEFVKRSYVPVETAVRVFKRYMQLKPEDAEEFIDYLHVKNRIDEAATLLCDIINRPHFQSKRNKTKYQLWEELCDMICEYADQIQSINAEAILRDGIARHSDQQGRLWNALARYYVHLGMFASARNIYDEAIHAVKTKKDFVEVWEAYTNFEEKYIERLLEQDDLTEEQMFDLEIRQASLEELITNNGLLLNRVALRQNPHNVREWQKRVQLCDQLPDAPTAKEETFIEAIKTIDPKQALGRYEDIWIDYATFQVESNDIERAREVFDKAVEAKFAKYDDLARVWCAYIELELRLVSGRAMKLAKRSTVTLKNLNLWSLYADLEENFGTFASAKAVYERILDLRIATPQLILNYADFLEERNYFEESFRAFERGVSIFKWPYSLPIWHTYLSKFFKRYGFKKLDRARDLLEHCLKDCPSAHSFEIYLLYAKLEEEEGLLSRAQDVYSRAVTKIEPKQRGDLFKIYIMSMMKLVDITEIRSIYEQAISTLDNKRARDFCLSYANLEEEQDEIDRARTIYSYCSQMCDPRVDKEFWTLWAEFEQRHGNLESIDDMLRIKRSVEAIQPHQMLPVNPSAA